MTLFYTWVAILGFAIQGLSTALSGILPERLYCWEVYALIFLIGAALCWPLTKFLSLLALLVAKDAWIPEVIRNQQTLYEQSIFIHENDGLRAEELKNIKSWSPEIVDKRKKENYQQVEENLNQFEKLLELPSMAGATVKERLDRVKTYFEKYGKLKK